MSQIVEVESYYAIDGRGNWSVVKGQTLLAYGNGLSSPEEWMAQKNFQPTHMLEWAYGTYTLRDVFTGVTWAGSRIIVYPRPDQTLGIEVLA